MGSDLLEYEDLKICIPAFQEGEAAQAQLEEGDHSPEEIARLESLAGLTDQAFDRVATLAAPLMKKEVSKLIRNSHIRNQSADIFGVVTAAGVAGMKKGFRKFNVEKLNSSVTNYLFMWFTTYAKSQLLEQEAPMGVAPSRFQRHKKIAAVRKKASEELGRPITNEELLDYFHSGRAEVKSMSGPKDRKKLKVSAANQSITLDLIEEQEEIEKNLSFAQFFDSEDETVASSITTEGSLFEETLIGAYVTTEPFLENAVAVLKSELLYDLTPSEWESIKDLTAKEIRDRLNAWKSYLALTDGSFRSYIQANSDSGFSEFDIRGALKLIDGAKRTISKNKLELLLRKDDLN